MINPPKPPEGTLLPIRVNGILKLALMQNGQWVDLVTRLPFSEDDHPVGISLGYTDRFGTEP